MTTRTTFAALLMLLIAATTAAAADPPVATAPGDDTDTQIAAWLADGSSDAAAEAPPPSPTAASDRAVHGEASLTVGSHGLRAAALSAVMPVGQDGALAVAVQDAQWGGRRGGEARSLAIGLRLGSGGGQEPCGLVHTGQQLLSDAARTRRCASLADTPTP